MRTHERELRDDFERAQGGRVLGDDRLHVGQVRAGAEVLLHRLPERVVHLRPDMVSMSGRASGSGTP